MIFYLLGNNSSYHSRRLEMSYEFYRIFHMMSLFTLFISLGILIIYPKYLKSLVLSVHGLSVVALFVSGFGLIAKLKLPLGLSSTFQTHGRPVIFILLLLITLNFIYLLLKKLFGFHISPWISRASSLALALYFLVLLPITLSPSWIGKKIMIWTLFAISPVFLRVFHSTKKWRVLVWIALLLGVAFYAVQSAVYKV